MDTPVIALSGTPVRWWQLTIIGIIIFLSGVDAFFLTPMFTGVLLTLFGILAFTVGIIVIIFSFTVRKQGIYRVPIYLAGILSFAVVVIALIQPGIFQASFIVIIAFIAIINSVLMILVGCSLSDQWKTRLIIVLFGMLLLFIGIVMVIFPNLSTFILVRVWGVYAWIVGLLCIIAGLSMKFMDRPGPAQ